MMFFIDFALLIWTVMSLPTVAEPKKVTISSPALTEEDKKDVFWIALGSLSFALSCQLGQILLARF